MKGEDDLLATQRLLEVIRGERDARGLSAASGMDQEPRKGEGLEPSLAAPGVLLTRALNSRRLLPGRVKVGLDVGRASVKMIRLERAARAFRLLQMGVGEVAPAEDSAEALMKAQAEVTKVLLRDVQPRKELIVTSVTDSGIIIRQATLPRMPPKELARSIQFEARKYMPYDPSEVILRYQLLPHDRRGPSCQVLMVAVPRQAVERHKGFLEMAGLKPYAVEVGPLALANAHFLSPRRDPEPAVLLDLGESRTVIEIFRDGGVFFCRHLSISGERFREEIAGRLGVSREAAEMIKRGAEVPGAPDAKDLVRALTPIMDELLVEIRRSMAYYDNVTGRLGFSRVLLTGGGALIKGLRRYLEEGLGLPVAIMDPLEGLAWDDGHFPRGWVEKTRPLWAGAVGLATRR